MHYALNILWIVLGATMLVSFGAHRIRINDLFRLEPEAPRPRIIVGWAFELAQLRQYVIAQQDERLARTLMQVIRYRNVGIAAECILFVAFVVALATNLISSQVAS